MRALMAGLALLFAAAPVFGSDCVRAQHAGCGGAEPVPETDRQREFAGLARSGADFFAFLRLLGEPLHANDRNHACEVMAPMVAYGPLNGCRWFAWVDTSGRRMEAEFDIGSGQARGFRMR